MADVKLLRDASPTRILDAIYRAGTDIQLAWFIAGCKAQYDNATFVAYVIAIESNPPHACTVVEIPPQFIDSAYALAVDIAKRYRVHELCDSFPGPTSGRLTYEPPRWATYEDDSETVEIETEA